MVNNLVDNNKRLFNFLNSNKIKSQQRDTKIQTNDLRVLLDQSSLEILSEAHYQVLKERLKTF